MIIEMKIIDMIENVIVQARQLTRTLGDYLTIVLIHYNKVHESFLIFHGQHHTAM